jgi:hypothetical protein
MTDSDRHATESLSCNEQWRSSRCSTPCDGGTPAASDDADVDADGDLTAASTSPSVSPSSQLMRTTRDAPSSSVATVTTRDGSGDRDRHTARNS